MRPLLRACPPPAGPCAHPQQGPVSSQEPQCRLPFSFRKTWTQRSVLPEQSLYADIEINILRNGTALAQRTKGKRKHFA